MSKNKFSDSLDLLLDTMCNTFGGVVFIAISLALAFFVCRDQFYAPDQTEKIEEDLKKEKIKAVALSSEKELLEKKLKLLKNFQYNLKTSKKTNIAEDVARLKQSRRELRRSIDEKVAELALMRHKKSALSEENSKKEKYIKENSKSIAQGADLSQKKQQLDLVINELTEQLKNMPVTSLHFAHNQRVSSLPYVILLRDNCLYQLGAKYMQSSPEVIIKKDNNMLIFSPVRGTWLSAISDTNLFSTLHEFNKQKNFLWILVHPDSFESFVKFRRMLRSAALPVHWSISYSAVVYLGSNRDYSAAY